MEGADRRSRRIDPDRRGRSGVRDVTAGCGRSSGREPSSPRARRECRGSRGASARWLTRRRARSGAHGVSRRGLSPCRRAPAVAVPCRGAGPAVRSPRQAQPRVTESGQRRTNGLRLVRHRADRRAQHGRHARLAASPRHRDLALHRQLGAQQFADALRRHAHPVVRSRAGRRICWRWTRAPASRCGEPIAARAGCRTARRWSSTRPPVPS